MITIIDCYHNDITQIVDDRSGQRLLRKMFNAARYARKHKMTRADIFAGKNKLRVFTHRIETHQGVYIPDAEGWAQWK